MSEPRRRGRGAEWRRGYNAGVAALSSLLIVDISGAQADPGAMPQVPRSADDIRKRVAKLQRRHEATLKLCAAVDEFQKAMADES
jgi:hypothetical protein